MTATTLALLIALPAQPAVPGSLEVRPEAVRKVLQAIHDAAQGVGRIPGPRPPGDDLTRLYLQAGARAAAQLPREDQAASFALGIALALDDSSILVGNILLRRLLRDIDPPEQRKARAALVGSPTIQGRRDWCQHLVVSAGLTVLGGSEAARAAGLLKEQLDARPGGSGFSLADYAADEAGIRLVELVVEAPGRLRMLAVQGNLANVMPEMKGLPEGLTLGDIEKKYGSLTDPRFEAELTRVRELVRKQPGIPRE